jgi:hypothetical protein
LALRICKTSLAPVKVVADQMAEGPVRARIDRWLKLWPELP